MFHATTVWKGLVYALLMFLAKVATGLWLVPKSLDPSTSSFTSLTWRRTRKTDTTLEPAQKAEGTSPGSAEVKPSDTEADHDSRPGASSNLSITDQTTPRQVVLMSADIEKPSVPAEMPSSVTYPRESNGGPSPSSMSPDPELPHPHSASQQNQVEHPPPAFRTPASTAPEPRALRAYSPALLGLSMAARGEIGFLIASVAESHGIFTPASSLAPASSGPLEQRDDELYLVVVWAIVLCTVVGPVAVGGLVRRMKRLEAEGQGT